MIDTERQPAPREVRIFGLLWLSFFGALGALAWWRPGALLGAAVFVGLAVATAIGFGGVGRGRRAPGALLPLLFAAAGALGRSGASPAVVVGLPLALGLGGALSILAAPALGARVWRLWMRAGAPVGWTVSRLVLGLVYYGVVTPIGFVMHLVGYDPLRRRFDRAVSSYWIARPRREGTERYFRQY